MQRPNTTAIKTTANILLLLENADKILFGITAHKLGFFNVSIENIASQTG